MIYSWCCLKSKTVLKHSEVLLNLFDTSAGNISCFYYTSTFTYLYFWVYNSFACQYTFNGTQSVYFTAIGSLK